jgi:periplasmic divalent cation tolerance protein
MKSILVVFCTCPDEETARALAEGLLEEKLAACVNVLPGIRSIYRWQGEAQDDSEVLMVVKTTQLQLDRLAQWLEQHHPYELPEVIALPVSGGLQGYLDWVAQETET